MRGIYWCKNGPTSQRRRLWVRGVDLKYPPYHETEADEFIIGDLRDVSIKKLQRKFDEIYQFADMGGAGFVFTGENDYEYA